MKTYKKRLAIVMTLMIILGCCPWAPSPGAVLAAEAGGDLTSYPGSQNNPAPNHRVEASRVSFSLPNMADRSDQNEAASTGDDSQSGLWIWLLNAAFVCLCCAGVYGTKRRNQR